MTLCAVLVNSLHLVRYAAELLPQLPQILSQSQPGDRFTSLRQYLRNVRRAGFYTDKISANPALDVAIMHDYQEAKFSLSPTILDYFHNLNYEFVVLSCSDNKSLQATTAQLNMAVVANLGNGIALGRRLRK